MIDRVHVLNHAIQRNDTAALQIKQEEGYTVPKYLVIDARCSAHLVN